ncbi:MAG: hypothetical protein HQL87_09840 [Magnetococcales bacterium]|nr:hypothetical protein [Magnetococcales bacterium]
MDTGLNPVQPTPIGWTKTGQEVGPGIILQFQQRGIHLTLAGESLAIDAPADALTDADLALLRTNKPAIMAALQGQEPATADPLQDLLRRIRETWPRFRQQHGKRLAALGWDRDNLLGGTDPMTATNVEDLDGFPVMVADGAELIYADETRIDLQRADGSMVMLAKAGFFLEGTERDRFITGAGPLLNDYELSKGSGQ